MSLTHAGPLGGGAPLLTPVSQPMLALKPCAVFQEKEEEAWLASMPAWRRDILRKKLEEER